MSIILIFFFRQRGIGERRGENGGRRGKGAGDLSEFCQIPQQHEIA